MKKEKVKQILILLGLCTFPIVPVALSGCGIKQSFTCKMCGSSSTYTPLYASGTAEANGTKYEYTSCVGPAGCVGFGCNTSCWPTECMYIQITENSSTTNGTIYYYDKTGCIGCSEEKSEETSLSKGQYSDTLGCMGINCSTSTYVEEINEDKPVAYTQQSCFGCTVGEKEYVDSRKYNDALDRKYEHGCASACYEE